MSTDTTTAPVVAAPPHVTTKFPRPSAEALQRQIGRAHV